MNADAIAKNFIRGNFRNSKWHYSESVSMLEPAIGWTLLCITDMKHFTAEHLLIVISPEKAITVFRCWESTGNGECNQEDDLHEEPFNDFVR